MASAVYSLEDLENAIDYLNKVKSARDIEDIYGDFDDPRFQAALRDAKGLTDELFRAVRYNSLIMLKNALRNQLRLLSKVFRQSHRELKKETMAWASLAKRVKNLAGFGPNSSKSDTSLEVRTVLNAIWKDLDNSFNRLNRRHLDPARAMSAIIKDLQGIKDFPGVANNRLYNTLLRSATKAKGLAEKRRETFFTWQAERKKYKLVQADINLVVKISTINIISDIWSLVLSNMY